MKIASFLFVATTLLGSAKTEDELGFRHQVDGLFSGVWKAAADGNADRVASMLAWDGFTENALIARSSLFLFMGKEPIPSWREGIEEGEGMYSAYSSRVLLETKKLLRELVKNKKIQNTFEDNVRVGEISDLGDDESAVRVLFPVSGSGKVHRTCVFKVIRSKDAVKIRASSFLCELGYRAFFSRVFPGGHGFSGRYSGAIGFCFSQACLNWYLMALDGEAAFCKRVVWLLLDLDWYEGWLTCIPRWLGAFPRKEPELIAELRNFASDPKLIERLKEVRVELRMYIALLMFRLGIDRGFEVLLAKEDIYEVQGHWGFWISYLPEALPYLLADPSKPEFEGKAALKKLDGLIGKTTFAERFKIHAAKVELNKTERLNVWRNICLLASAAGVDRAVQDYLKLCRLAKKYAQQDAVSGAGKARKVMKQRIELMPLLYASRFKSLIGEKTLSEINYYPVVAATGYSQHVYELLIELCANWENLERPYYGESRRLLFWRWGRKLGAPSIQYLSFAPEELREKMVKPWRRWLARQRKDK